MPLLQCTRSEAGTQKPHQQSRNTLRGRQAENQGPAWEFAPLPAPQLWFEIECSVTQTGKSGVKGNLCHTLNLNTSHLV